MRETFTSGSVGRAAGNRCLYPEADCLQRPLRFRFRQRLRRSVILPMRSTVKQRRNGTDFVAH